jgi:hypothetical protein
VPIAALLAAAFVVLTIGAVVTRPFGGNEWNRADAAEGWSPTTIPDPTIAMSRNAVPMPSATSRRTTCAPHAATRSARCSMRSATSS